MIQSATIQITPEMLALVASIDEFKGAWRALGTLAPGLSEPLGPFSFGLSLPLGLLAAIICTGLLALLVDWLLFARLRQRGGAVEPRVAAQLIVAVADPSPGKVQAAIRIMLLSLIMLDASLVFFFQPDGNLHANGFFAQPDRKSVV